MIIPVLIITDWTAPVSGSHFHCWEIQASKQHQLVWMALIPVSYFVAISCPCRSLANQTYSRSEWHHARQCIARLDGYTLSLSKPLFLLPCLLSQVCLSLSCLYSFLLPHLDWQSIKFFVLLPLIRLSWCESFYENCCWKYNSQIFTFASLSFPAIFVKRREQTYQI